MSSAFIPSGATATPRAPPSSVVSPLLSSGFGLAPSSSTTIALPHPAESRWWGRNFALTGAGTGVRTTIATGGGGGDEGGGQRPARATVSSATNVSAVSFSPAHPHLLAVASGPRVSLYNPSASSVVGGGGDLARELRRSLQPNYSVKAEVKIAADRTIPAPAPVYALSYRADGRLLATGCEDGRVRVCDATTRSVLRTFGGNAGGPGGGAAAVRCVAWLRDGTHLVSGGDDATIRLWDLSSYGGGGGSGSGDGPVLTLSGHGDAIRDLCVLSVPGSAARPGDAAAKGQVPVGGKRKRRSQPGDSSQQQQQQQQQLGASGGGYRYLLVSGSYDHTMRVWDLNAALELLRRANDDGPSASSGPIDGSDACLVSVVQHGAPVEALLPVPADAMLDEETRPSRRGGDSNEDGEGNGEVSASSAIVACAGGTTIKLWDVSPFPSTAEKRRGRRGRRPAPPVLLASNESSHGKTVTSLCLASDCGAGRGGGLEDRRRRRPYRILSAGLDGFVRVYRPSTLQCLHGHKFPGPVLCLSMSPSAPDEYEADEAAAHRTSSPSPRMLVVGTADGMMSVVRQPRRRKLPSPDSSRTPRGGTYSFFTRGGDATPSPDDYRVVREKRRRLRPFDRSLRGFRYGEALDEALATKQPQAVCAVLEELAKRRSGLEVALSNRDEESLEPILAFTARYVAQPRYTPLLVGVASVLCDVYEPVLGRSAVVDELFEKLRRHVRGEVRVQRDMLGLLGQIDGVLSVAEMLQSSY